ncbi:MAG: phosphatase PAP2 family protein [Candidatus Cloacimonetes bacterium]|nr:phosphatase PAP2 family protein [Candidatus Cloacimonadota bacterium]
MSKRDYKTMLSDLLIPLLLLTGITLLFRAYKWDMILQYRFWNKTAGWFMGDAFPWKQLYHFGNLPALILSLTALVVLTLSFFKRNYERFQKLTAYLVLVMLIAPGIIINGALKQNWGRPRPRDLIEFNGHYQYEKVLEYDKSSGGNSFPCGHASMGFYFFAPALLFRKKKWKFYLILMFGWILGLSIGLARMIQGGHFASDVLWSALIVYWVSYLMFYLLKLDISIYPQSLITEKFRNSKLLATGSIAGGILLIGLVLTASPYTKHKSYRRFKEYNPVKSTAFYLSLLTADIKVDFRNEFQYNVSINGFGFPGSKLTNKFHSDVTDSTQVFSLTQETTGFFSELRQEGEIALPSTVRGNVHISVAEGNAYLTLPADADSLFLDIELSQGIFTLYNPYHTQYKLLKDTEILYPGLNIRLTSPFEPVIKE